MYPEALLPETLQCCAIDVKLDSTPPHQPRTFTVRRGLDCASNDIVKVPDERGPPATAVPPIAAELPRPIYGNIVSAGPLVLAFQGRLWPMLQNQPV